VAAQRAQMHPGRGPNASASRAATTCTAPWPWLDPGCESNRKVETGGDIEAIVTRLRRPAGISAASARHRADRLAAL